MSFEAEQGIIPIPIRADLTVRIWGLPADLTPAEAAKIGAVVAALSGNAEPADARAEGPAPSPDVSDEVPGRSP